MTAPDPQRRRFLGGLAAALGLAGAGIFGWRTRPDAAPVDGVAAPPPATTTTSTSPAPQPTTTEPPAPPAESSTSVTELPIAAEVVAICGEAWGALPSQGEFTEHVIERLTVHHTASLLESNTDAPARARQHQGYHLSLGWPDLAYHYVVDANGNVYAGRPVDAVGDTGTEYDPTGHFLVCCEGNFDEQAATDAQVAALADVLAWAAATFGVGVDTIAGHRDYASTSCPGERLYPLIVSGDLRRQVQERLDAGGVRLTTLCGEDAVGRVASIETGVD